MAGDLDDGLGAGMTAVGAPLLGATLAVLERPSSLARARFEPPAPDEHDPYYTRYISRVPAGDFLSLLRAQADEVARFFAGVGPAQADFAYATGKWTVKEVLAHLSDTERVFAFRAACFARQDRGPLPSFEQDHWSRAAGAASRPLRDLLAEWLVVRAGTLVLAGSLTTEALVRRGVASGKEISVRALLYGQLGHVEHHLEGLRDRYLGDAAWPR
jgi:hypothetical protein